MSIKIPSPNSVPNDPGICEETDIINPVFFDLETSGFALTSDILQISAIDKSGNSFNSYLTPTQDISDGASKVTGLTTHDHRLYLNGRLLDTVIPLEALGNFLLWLEARKPVLLIAHNASFDSKRLIRASVFYKLDQSFRKCVTGIGDTLPYFKSLFPDLKRHSQEVVAKHVLGGQFQYSAHDALADVTALQQIYEAVSKCDLKPIVPFSKNFGYLIDLYFYERNGEANFSTYKPLIEKKLISQPMAKKAAQSGLSVSHLKLAYNREGMKGEHAIRALLSEKFNGKPRVTSHTGIIRKISTYFEKASEMSPSL
jgi:DNA polymerase III epsilon subunit-like protein